MTTKYDEEKRFWKDEIGRYVQWYRGRYREMYGVNAPTNLEKIRRYPSEEQNAIETWVNLDRWRYCKHLFVEPTYFSGRSVLEVGCGPLGLSRFFAGARVTGLDPLHEWYAQCGYDTYANYDEVIEMKVEDIGDSGYLFDAVVSVNAIDHVDDFEAAIAAIESVCHDETEIRIEVHYHAPTITEPIVLNDDRVQSAFKRFSVQKIAENPSSLFYPRGTHPVTDRFALWSNRDYLYDAVRVL